MSHPKLYLLDVEGTVAPLSLTSDQLFPYARTHLHRFLHESLERPDIQQDLHLLAAENRAEQSQLCPTFGIEIRNELHAREYLYWLMDHDRKSTALKSLQGKIWKHGFESGELKGSLFPDVPAAFKRWSQSARVAIYSSGSTEAQQLLFRHSVFGDLTPCIAAYFDTRTGPKESPDSYAAIARATGVEPAEVLFFSDALRELDAARASGCQTRLTLREGNTPLRDHNGHCSIHSLEQQ